MSKVMETNKLKQRWEEIKYIYCLVLVDGWYIANYHDQWEADMTCFLLWNKDCTKKDVVRLP